MNLFQAFFLGVLQGATEFLPVSSSGHLVLVPWLLGWGESGLAFDAVVHWGTALAVVVYFWHDWVSIVRAAFCSLRALVLRRLRATPADSGPSGSQAVAGSGQESGDASDAWLAWYILLASIPAALIGFLLEDFFEDMFARPVAAAAFLLLTAGLLSATEWLGRRERSLEELTWLDALVVGLAQALAIFPGISRSGATIAAGLARGLRREPAARFSFLLATPVILGAGLFELVNLAQVGNLTAQNPALVCGFLAASVVGFGCIHFLLRYLQRHRLYPFAVYCVALSALGLLAALVRGM